MISSGLHNMDKPDLLSRVKLESRKKHEQLEALVSIDSDLSLQSYRELLGGLFGLFAPLENALQYAPIPDQLDFQRRQRTPLLISDLEVIGGSVSGALEFPLCTDLPALHNMPRALGCMYVLEGSRLGGQYISRVVRERLGLTEQNGCAFFSSGGIEVGSLWRSFGDVVRERVVVSEDQDEFISSAISTFSVFVEWFEGKRCLTPNRT